MCQCHITDLKISEKKHKTNKLVLYKTIKLLVQRILVQRDYKKTTMKILCTKIRIIVRLVNVNFIWVLKFGT